MNSGAFENCTECGRVYAFLARGICADCLNARERLFQDVKTWLRRNPTATIETAAEATGVDIELILEWIRDGRIRRTPQAGDVRLAEVHAQEERRKRLQEDLSAATDAVPPASPVPPTTTSPHRGFNARRNHHA